MLLKSALKSAESMSSCSPQQEGVHRRVDLQKKRQARVRQKSAFIAAGVAILFSSPAPLLATHEADHRFTVEGFVCGPDGKGAQNVEVLVKDTRISYGQTVTTNGDGYYTATFHLHNDNLGDPLFVEARGEQQDRKVQFDPKDLEAERRIQVHFGAGCIHNPSAPPMWVLVGAGVAAVGVGG